MNRKLIELQYNIMFPNDQTSFDQSENYIDFAEHIAKLATAEREEELKSFIRDRDYFIKLLQEERDALQDRLDEFANHNEDRNGIKL